MVLSLLSLKHTAITSLRFWESQSRTQIQAEEEENTHGTLPSQRGPALPHPVGPAALSPLEGTKVAQKWSLPLLLPGFQWLSETENYAE